MIDFHGKFWQEVEMPFLPVSPGILIGGSIAGSLICAVSVLIFANGWRRGPVRVGALLLLSLHLLALIAWLSSGIPVVQEILLLFTFCLFLATLPMIPGLVLTSLMESPCRSSVKGWHAAIPLSSWICGPVAVLLAVW